MSDISTRVKKIVSSHLGVELDKVLEDANFADDLGADSLEIMEMVIALEEEFDVVIPDEAGDTPLTVGDAANHIESALIDRGSAGVAVHDS